MLPGPDADHRRRCAARRAAHGRSRPSPAAASPNRGRPAARRAASAKRSGVTGAPRQITEWTLAGREILEQHDVGALARRHQAAIDQAEMAGRRPGGGAIGVERPHAAADGGADQVVDMAFLGDVERVAVVGAERQEGRALGRDQLGAALRDPWTPCPRGSGSACPWRASRAPRRPTSSRGSCVRRRRCRR